MALVKTNKITPDKDPEAARGTAATDSRKRARTYAKQQKGAEQIAAATQELSAGVTQASASADRLQTSMEQISTGAQEAAQTAETSREATTESNRLLTEAAAAAQQSLDKTNLLQELVGELGGTVSESIENIRTAANRQAQSVEMIQELESQAASIGDIVQAVARIADQTNLLALNAAIEAARAGQHGKGFAVVADEVRTLAETSEKSAEHIEQLVKTIQSEVSGIGASIRETAETASSEAERGREVIERLTGTKTDMAEVAKGAQAILRGAEASSAAATQAQSSSESISAASEQQAAAVEEALRTLEAQTASLQQCDSSSQQLSELADELRESSDIEKSAEELAAAAEELSAAVEEISRSATQINEALDQIEQGAGSQSKAAEQASEAMETIESGCVATEQQANEALMKSQAIRSTLDENRTRIDALVAGVATSLERSLESRDQMKELEKRSREIDKIVDAITTVSIQTNMLAVNGSVEAARAGEFGKGFAVVSTDIRNLAQESAENADRIKDLVKSIQDQIGVVRGDLGEIVEAARLEVAKNEEITKTLGQVAEDMTEVYTGNENIRDASQAILGQVSAVKTGVTQIAAVAEQASKAAGEAGKAASEQASGAAQLASAVEEIASMADELQNG